MGTMRAHAEIGEQLVARIPGLAAVAPIVRHHHERWDGAGYPDRLRGIAIPLEARIVGAADAYSALTSDRCYRRAVSQSAAVAELRRSRGSHLDAAVVDALIATLQERSHVLGAGGPTAA
jgi:HD-GYP domain-containing protein (c-di-GMP phosphodiesterase class II)